MTTQTLIVPLGGLAERFVFEALGLSSATVYPLHGDVIGSPRDYLFRGAGHIYTAEGVRRIAAHFGIQVEVVTEPAPPPPRPPVEHRLPDSRRGTWMAHTAQED